MASHASTHRRLLLESCLTLRSSSSRELILYTALHLGLLLLLAAAAYRCSLFGVPPHVRERRWPPPCGGVAGDARGPGVAGPGGQEGYGGEAGLDVGCLRELAPRTRPSSLLGRGTRRPIVFCLRREFVIPPAVPSPSEVEGLAWSGDIGTSRAELVPRSSRLAITSDEERPPSPPDGVRWCRDLEGHEELPPPGPISMEPEPVGSELPPGPSHQVPELRPLNRMDDSFESSHRSALELRELSAPPEARSALCSSASTQLSWPLRLASSTGVRPSASRAPASAPRCSSRARHLSEPCAAAT